MAVLFVLAIHPFIPAAAPCQLMLSAVETKMPGVAISGNGGMLAA
jgi:hypothetical protein